MESPGAVGRRRGTSRSNVEDQALDQIAKEVSQSNYFRIFLSHFAEYRIVFTFHSKQIYYESKKKII